MEPHVGVASRTTWRVSGGRTCQAVGAQVGSDLCILSTLLGQWIPACAKWSRRTHCVVGGMREKTRVVKANVTPILTSQANQHFMS